jgi:glutamyl-tRNA reductase
MGTLAAKALARTGVETVTVANRSPDRAADLAEMLDGDARAADLDGVEAALADAHVTVTATSSSEPLLDRATLAEAGETVVIDLGQPRDAPRDPPANVAVYDIDDLEAVTASTREQRQAAAEQVETIVATEFDRLLTQFKRRQADEAIAAMYESADRLKRREVATAISRLESEGEFDEDQREVVESLADALVSRLLAAPTESLRAAAERDDWDTIQTALELFDPEFEDGSVTAGRSGDETAPAEAETAPDGEVSPAVEDGD